jgi:iron complex transport system substrate-binding protein
MKKPITILLIAAIAVLSAACGDISAKNYRVIDSRGVEISFESAPRRIISLVPNDTEIICELGAGDSLIAVSDYCNFPEEVNRKQKLPTGEKLNVETLISLEPDVVFIGKMGAMEDQIRQLEEAGIKVVVTEANSISDTYDVIGMIGSAIGKEKEAASLVDRMKAGFERVRSEAAEIAVKSVYVEASPLQYGLWSCGEGTFTQEILDMIGAKNIFEDTEGWCAVSEEQVIDRNPDIIFTMASPTTGIEDPVGDIMGRENWGGITAVKNGHVFMLDSDMLNRPGPRLYHAARTILELIIQAR